MHFLIDFENVGEPGLSGSGLLTENDSISLFYHEGMKIRRFIMDNLIRTDFTAIKLKTISKNALDYYLSTRIGEITQKDRENKIVILSNDKGFDSTIEYCSLYTDLKHPVTRFKDIATAIQVLDCDSERGIKIYKMNQRVSIESEYGAYSERMRFKKELAAAFDGSGYEEVIDQIYAIVDRTDNPRDRYLTTLKTLGKEKGNAVYRILKEVV